MTTHINPIIYKVLNDLYLVKTEMEINQTHETLNTLLTWYVDEATVVAFWENYENDDEFRMEADRLLDEHFKAFIS